MYIIIKRREHNFYIASGWTVSEEAENLDFPFFIFHRHSQVLIIKYLKELLRRLFTYIDR